MITDKDRDLQSALDFCGLTTLPKKWNSETSKRIWVDALIEVKKCNGRTSYAYAHNRYGLDTPCYKKIWGDSATICEALSIHPIHYLDKDFIIKAKTIDEMRDKLKKVYNISDEEMKGIPDEKVQTLAYNYAIQSQIVFVKQDGKDKYKKQQNDKNEKIFKEITEGKN